MGVLLVWNDDTTSVCLELLAPSGAGWEKEKYLHFRAGNWSTKGEICTQ
jgi:hypothetical protein